MKRIVLLVVCVLAISGLAACGSSTNSGNNGNNGNSSNKITMGATTFSPTTLTIKKGDTITFVDDSATGSPHELVNGTNGVFKAEAGASDFGGSDGKDFKPGDSWTTPTWNTPGTYHVTCTIHPTTMNLTITVTG